MKIFLYFKLLDIFFLCTGDLWRGNVNNFEIKEKPNTQLGKENESGALLSAVLAKPYFVVHAKDVSTLEF